MTAPEICVGAIVIFDNDILLIKRAAEPYSGTWSIPGGRVRDDEPLKKAIERELLEETGIRGKCQSFIGMSEMKTEDFHGVILDFEVSIREKTRPTPSSDAAEAEWVPMKSLDHLEMPEGLKDFLLNHGYLSK